MNYVFAHLIGDYFFQNDWMAQNKKKSAWHCFIHVVTYMIPFLLCVFASWQLLAIALQHYAVDRSNFVMWLMKAKGSQLFATGPCFPWSIIVTDNITHILWIAFVAWMPELFDKLAPFTI